MISKSETNHAALLRVGQLPTLRGPIGNLRNSANGVESAIESFTALYEPFRLMAARERGPAWAAFVMAEGLRVEDLDPRPGREVVRSLSCALVGAGLKQFDVAVVVGEKQVQVSRWWTDFRRSAALNGGGLSGPGVIMPAPKVSPAMSPKALAAQELALAEAARRVPESGLILAEDQLKALPGFLSEYGAGLAEGGQVGPGVDELLRRIYRELVKAVDTVQVFQQQRGIRL